MVTNLVCGMAPSAASTSSDHAVDHRQDALDLAAEIGVAGRVDDVDPHALPDDRGAFGQDGDAALALEIVGVHRAFGDLLVGAESARLLQELVDQGGLPVVDMGDDGDVADIHGGHIAPLDAASCLSEVSGRAP
jgi:hypothetical protein